MRVYTLNENKIANKIIHRSGVLKYDEVLFRGVHICDDVCRSCAFHILAGLPAKKQGCIERRKVFYETCFCS